MIDQVKSAIKSVTEIGVALLALAIVATILLGSAQTWVFGDVVDNLIVLIRQFGDAGLAGLIALGVVLWLFQK